MPSNGRTKATAPYEELRIGASPEALESLRAALARQPPGRGLRLWVEPGMRPQVRMMIDSGTPNDRRISLEGVEVFVDPPSIRYLQDARIEHGQLEGKEGFRVVGPNVPAVRSSPEAPSPTATAPTGATVGGKVDRGNVEDRVRTALKGIYDPEIPMNLIDLGLIYGFEWGEGDALTIRMTLTSVGCPATEAILHEVEAAAKSASGLPSVKAEIVWDPPWTPERMSLFAKRQFGYA
ncbi:MAG TPA: iron-sulfur cluster assembly protein [Thermoplasmata archaeon]|nr:iron-sulfur cluster assembly protein [Thermoplasmata archaeon]